MRILHTSDWHLGRVFHQVRLTDDRDHVLGLFVALARDLRPDVVVIAGDLYDRAVPPPEAVELLDDVLTRLVYELGVPSHLFRPIRSRPPTSASRSGHPRRTQPASSAETLGWSDPPRSSQAARGRSCVEVSWT